jgi:homoisocitrate dehydrogenase
MLADYLGFHRAAERIRAAVGQVLRDGRSLTPDLGGKVTTSAMTAAILQAMETVKEDAQPRNSRS